VDFGIQHHRLVAGAGERNTHEPTRKVHDFHGKKRESKWTKK
jgi:hypothetical protein